MAVQTLIQVRRGLASEWASANPTLSAGEWGYETNTGRYKIGDGLTAWNSLRYSSLLPKSGELVGTSGINISFSATTGVPVTISVTGLTIGTDVQAYDAGLQSISDLATTSDNYLYTTGSDTYTTGIITSFGRSLLDDNNSSEARTTLGLGTIATYNSGDYSLSGHTHSWSDITDASARATLNELTYLSGVTAGTVSASRALVVDSNKDLTGLRHLTTEGNITVGGNLVVNGTTTTVNSTTVDVGDNIIRVNTSGLTTGGFEVYTGSDYKQLVWNVSTNRWEFSGGNIYTSGSYIGSLSGNASTVTNGVYTTDTGTVTSTMIADNTIVNADINSSAAIAYSKLNLTGGVVNADVSSSASIAYSKLNLSSSIVDSDISSSAAVAYSKLNLTSSIVNADISSSAAIAYSKLNLTGGIVNSDISSTAAIAVTKLAASGVTFGSTTVNLGQSTSSINGLTSISGTSALNPTTLYYCVIDGGSP